jgi:AcrR family transcriptional regulator
VARQPAPRKRLPRQDREHAIIQGAVAFFAEVGFDGGTRELATRLGVTQPLLYRYFPSKEALLDRVYQTVYLSNWDPHWESQLADHSVPLEERLIAFYGDYARVILNYEWIRLFMFAGLKGLDFNTRYLTFMRGSVFERVVRELRLANGLSVEPAPRSEEIELVWSLHASIFYIGVRKWIYGLPTPLDLDADLAWRIRAFLHGAPAAFKALAENAADPAPDQS